MLVKRYTYVISSLAKKFAELHYYNTSVKIYRTKKLNNGSRVTGSAI